MIRRQDYHHAVRIATQNFVGCESERWCRIARGRLSHDLEPRNLGQQLCDLSLQQGVCIDVDSIRRHQRANPFYGSLEQSSRGKDVLEELLRSLTPAGGPEPGPAAAGQDHGVSVIENGITGHRSMLSSLWFVGRVRVVKTGIRPVSALVLWLERTPGPRKT